jgi:hypothetical protein
MLRFHSLLPFFVALLCTLVLGYLIGRLTTVQSWSHIPLTLQQDTRPLVPVVTFVGFENGYLTGTAKGTVRITGDALGVETMSGSFKIPVYNIEKIIRVPVPEGMQFVASKNGKKYYPVFSVSGQKIAPDNRIYFKTEQEAELAGYRK